MRNEQRAQAQEQDDIISNVVKMFYDPAKYKLADNCVICMGDFELNQEVTPLPCDMRHVFHTECITQWMKTQTKCPLCKAEITVEK
jgi:E3 ubiquitin-protein ligase DOA10